MTRKKKPIETRNPELLKIAKKQLEVTKNHKNVSEKQLKTSMPVSEQRNWRIASLTLTFIFGIIMTLLAQGIFLRLEDPSGQELPYEVSVSVSPSAIMLNQQEKVELTFNFTNTGTKNISKFNIEHIELYRQVNDELVKCASIVPSSSRPSLKCSSWRSNTRDVDMSPGRSCTHTTTLDPEYVNCFDDKDKPLKFFVYMEAVPPINDQTVELSLY